MRRAPKTVLLPPALLAALLLAGCGSSSSTASSGTTGAPPATTAPAADPTGSAPATDATGTTAPDAPPSVAPAGAGALPGVPAVTQHATDLHQQPVVAPGTGTPSAQLVVRDLVVGSGTSAVSTNTVTVHYTGSVFATGKVFDASWTDGAAGQQATFPLGEVVPGFREGIVGMKPGGRREIVIPPALGYGPQGGQPQAGIGPTDTLVFVVDLDSIKD